MGKRELQAKVLTNYEIFAKKGNRFYSPLPFVGASDSEVITAAKALVKTRKLETVKTGAGVGKMFRLAAPSKTKAKTKTK